jgi:hypothetical protein
MAEDPRSQSNTDDLPRAAEAFSAERDEQLRAPAFAVSRAAALLSLIRPAQLDPIEYLSVVAETRELLEVIPVEPFVLDRSSFAGQLEDAGGLGFRAARLLWEKSGLEEPDFEPQGSTPLLRELRLLSEEEREAVHAAQRDAAAEVFSTAPREGSEPRRQFVVRLVAASLLDEDPLVQVAAAAATLRIDARNPLAEGVLRELDREGSDEIAELSRTVLATDRHSETRRIEVEHPRGVPDSSADSALVHGTWTRWGRWWRPDGQLHRYLREEEGLFPHLYRGDQPFEWSGYFSFRAWGKTKKDWNRQQAADSLAWWAERKLKPVPDLVGHSYGGSLSMLTTQAEKRVRGLVLLSPAVHQTCLPDPENYDQILHVTTKHDLVLLADLSNPSLLRSMPNVSRWRVKRKGLTGHGTTHDPQAWRDSGLTEHVRDAWLPSLTSRP